VVGQPVSLSVFIKVSLFNFSFLDKS